MAADGSVIIEILGDAQDVTNKIKGVASGAVKTLTTAIAGVSTALAGVTAAAIKVGAGFEESMSQVAATMGLSVEEIQNGSEAFDTLSAAAKEAGATTAFSASQAAEALNYLALAGYDAATAAEVLPSVLNLAAAGGMGLGYASDLATDAMAALGIEASKANLEQFGDKLASAASHANASVAQLGEAILVVGGTAKSLAGGTTELNAALGVLANRGIKGAEGGTALRNIILSLSAPTDKAAKLMQQLGVSVYDAKGKMRPLNETFKDLSAAMEGMTEGEKTNVLNDIFNKVDLKSAQALLAGTGEEFDALAAAIENSQGAMENMAGVQLDNLNGDITILKSGLEGLGIALYETMQVNARGAVQSITGAVSAISEALTSGGISQAIQVAGQQIGNFAVEIAMQVPNLISAGAQLLQAIVSGILVALPQLQSVAGELFGNLVSYLQANLPQMIAAGLSALLSFSEGFRENVGSLVDATIELVKTLADGIIAALPDLIAKVPEIVSNLAGAINDNAPKLLLAAAELIAKLAQGIIKNIPVLIANAPKIAIAIFDVITAFNWLSLGKKIVTGIINGIKSLFGSVATTAQTLAQNLRTVISDLPGYFKVIGKDMIKGLINGIKSMANSVVENARSIGTLALNALKSALGGGAGQKSGEALSKAVSDSSKIASKSMKSLAQSTLKTISENLKLADSSARNVKSFESQANAIDQAKKSLSGYGSAGKTASKQIKTQAEKDLEEYTALKDALDHQRTMDEISTEEYYRSLSELRDKYLSDEANISEYRRASEELHKIDEQSLAAEKKVFEEREKLREEFTSTAQKAAEEVLKLEENYQKELGDRTKEIANSYKLFDEVPKKQKVSGNELLKNLEAQNKSIETFYANLDQLSQRQGSTALVDEIRAMGVGAQDQLTALLGMTDEKLQQYAEAYEEKQQMANELAAKELEWLRAETDQKIQEQIDSVKDLYDENASVLGFEFTQGIAEGIRSGISDAVSAAIELAQSVADAAKGELDINSPSRVGRDEIGKMFDAGVSEGIDDGTEDVVKSAGSMAGQMTSSLQNNLLDGVDISGLTKQLRAAVEAESARLSAQLTISSNAPVEARAARDTRVAAQTAAANAAANSSADNGDAVINIDGFEFYRATLKSLRTVEDQTPRTVDDT